MSSVPASDASNHVPYRSKQMIVVRRDLKMRKGKIAAQAGHACVEATLGALLREHRQGQLELAGERIGLSHAPHDVSPLTDWFDAGIAKVCVYVDSEEELLDLADAGRALGFYVALIRDAGHTEFHGEATYTCLAFEPLPPEEIDQLTGNLPLY